MENESLDRPHESTPRLVTAVCTVSVLAAMCLSYSLLRAPIPGPNEPHYLTKARHFWDPQWCPGDLFLQSSNPHAVFYALIGWLPELVGFETTALIGRAAAALFLAVGWYVLVTAARSDWLTPIVAFGLLLVFQALGNLSGEWIVGGAESKTFSYALAFLGWGLLMRGRLLIGGACLGLCFSLHPIVGAWVMLATLLTWMAGLLFGLERAESRRPSMAHRLTACGVAAIGMLPGIWASLPMIAEGRSPEADLLQVGRRLAHHLDPLTFPMEAWRYYATLVAMWGMAAWIGRLQRTASSSSDTFRLNAVRFLRLVVAASFVFAVAGVAIAWGERPFADLPGAAWRAWMLKFYPFRLIDVLLPVIVAIELGAALTSAVLNPVASSPLRRRRPMVSGLVMATMAVAAPLLLTWRMPYSDRPSSRMEAQREADWRAICEWVDREIPQGALFWAANENWAVKWYAERAEYVNYKDCPQDADNLFEWERRLQKLADWTEAAVADRRFTIEDFDRLYHDTGITHILCSRFGPMPSELRLLHEIGDFKVYAIYTEAECPCETNAGATLSDASQMR